jgi:hypothetical protein
MSDKVRIIAPDAYPQMLDETQAARLGRSLRSRAVQAEAGRIIAAAAPGLRAAVLLQVAELEAADQNLGLVSDKAHEIKGFADTAGLPAAAQLAEGLCRYLERSQELSVPPDSAVVALHVRAIVRAARSGDAGPVGEAVAAELAALAARKLAEASLTSPAEAVKPH